eukprot:COSAG04_NODE_1574_length_6276_cov_3.068480_4_plen_797_part_00
MSKRPAMGFGKLSFGSKAKKPRAFGEDAEVRRPPPGALMGGAPPATAAAGGAGRKEPAGRAYEEEEDPLDAFMSGVSQEVRDNKPSAAAKGEEMEEEDMMDGYQHKDGVGGGGGGDNSDDEVYAAAKKADKVAASKDKDDDDSKPTGVLPVIDHSEVVYLPFRRDFYQESAEVAGMSEQAVSAYKKELDVSVTWLTGGAAPRPVQSFKQVGFPTQIMRGIEKAGYEKPSAVQAQAWPVLLSGRDVIGIAKTGSGKTAAFVLPGLVHLMDQTELQKNEGPIMVVLAPTRELAAQIYVETKKFAKGYNLKVGAIYGGMSKFEQFKVLKAGVEVVVATPGRLIDLIKMKGTNLGRCTYVVLDEADRMLNMGFESQVRSIVAQVRPSRQVAMFSATFKRNIEGLARDLLRDPVRITVGSVGQSNKDVQQYVEVLKNEEAKWMWVVDNLDRLLDQGQVLVFRGTKDDCDAMANKLKRASYNANSIHGDKDQRERDAIMKDFKSGMAPILVATDVASRGLDIRGIKNVVNFDVARDIDSHVHRIGRTGRAGDKGQAFTLVDRSNRKDSGFAGDLVRNLEMSEQFVPPALLDFAMENPKFQQRRARGTTGLGFGDGGGGGGGRKRGGNNPHVQQTVGGLGYSGSDAGVLGKGRGKGGGQGAMGSGFGMAFEKSSGGPQTAEAGGLIPAKKHMGMVSATASADAFDIRDGGLQQSAAAARNQAASSNLLASGPGFGLTASAGQQAAEAAKASALAAAARINKRTESAAPPAAPAGDDWLSQAKAQAGSAPPAAEQPKPRQSRWG